MAIFRSTLILLLTWYAGLTTAEEALLDHQTRDWAQVREAAKAGDLAVMLLVSGEDCGYCELLKQEVLSPMHRNGQLEGRAMVREMDLHAGGKIIDFDGEKVRAGIFLGRYKVFATPTLLFLDADGRPLHEPLVGFNGSENYLPKLEQALHETRVALQQLGGKTRIADRPSQSAAQIP